jgi:hypothetical protein
MGFEVVFPSLRKAGEKDKGAISAKIGWLEGNQVFAIMGNKNSLLYTLLSKHDSC